MDNLVRVRIFLLGMMAGMVLAFTIATIYLVGVGYLPI